jgi:hypothetical protein
MDPKKRRKSPNQADKTAKAGSHGKAEGKPGSPYEETDADREKALADAEWKNLWDATEVIDMDRW